MHTLSIFIFRMLALGVQVEGLEEHNVAQAERLVKEEAVAADLRERVDVAELLVEDLRAKVCVAVNMKDRMLVVFRGCFVFVRQGHSFVSFVVDPVAFRLSAARPVRRRSCGIPGSVDATYLPAWMPATVCLFSFRDPSSPPTPIPSNQQHCPGRAPGRC